MSIISGFTDTALAGIFSGSYNFTSDTFKMALYTSSASLSPSSTTAYSSTNECSGTGYSAGGFSVTCTVAAVSNRQIAINWANVTTAALTISDIRGGVIYDVTAANAAILVVDFGLSIRKSAATLTVTFPTSGALVLKAA